MKVAFSKKKKKNLSSNHLIIFFPKIHIFNVVAFKIHQIIVLIINLSTKNEEIEN